MCALTMASFAHVVSHNLLPQLLPTTSTSCPQPNNNVSSFPSTRQQAQAKIFEDICIKPYFFSFSIIDPGFKISSVTHVGYETYFCKKLFSDKVRMATDRGVSAPESAP